VLTMQTMQTMFSVPRAETGSHFGGQRLKSSSSLSASSAPGSCQCDPSRNSPSQVFDSEVEVSAIDPPLANPLVCWGGGSACSVRWQLRGETAKTSAKAGVAPDSSSGCDLSRGPVIVVDSREQAPYTFGGRVETVRFGLPTGDYSLLGFETTVVVERKALPDYVQSLTAGRDRFLRECERLAAFPVKAVVVEGSFDDIVHARYGSLATPQSIVGSTIKLLTDFGLPVVLAGCRAYAERFTERMLTRHWEHAVKGRAA
jgi:DNA excision repair protein ERCC-4